MSQRVFIDSSSSTVPAVATSSACTAMSFACPLGPSYKASIHLDGTAHIVLAFASWPRHDAILDVEFALGAGLESVAVVGEGATVLRTRFDRGAQVVTFELRGVNAASSGVGGGHHFTFIGRPIEGGTATPAARPADGRPQASRNGRRAAPMGTRSTCPLPPPRSSPPSPSEALWRPPSASSASGADWAAAAPNRNTAPAAARSAPRSQPCSRSPSCKAVARL